jgi:tetratricopeptide (TPR) repeat protein
MKHLLWFALSFFAGLAAGQKVDQARQLFEAGKYDEASKLLLKVPEGKTDYAAARYYLGRIAFNEKKLDEAQEYFEEAIDANDQVADYHNWLGNAYGSIAQNANMMRQGMLAPKMKGAWERAVALEPTMLEPRQSLIQYYLQAPGFMGGSVEKARETALAIKKINLAEGHRQLGNVYQYQKKFAEAEKEFVAMAKADASYKSALSNYYVNQKKFSEAFRIFDEELKVNPYDHLAGYQIGRLAALSGHQTDRGEALLKKYLTYSPQPNEPSHAGAHMRLGQIHEKRGNKAEAKKCFETALRLDATLKEAKEGLARVNK